MSARVDKFCDGLRDRLNAIETRIETAKVNVEALPGKAQTAVQEHAAQVRSKFKVEQQRAEKARADLRAWADQKKVESIATINDWKSKREAKNLVARADRAEAYAEAALAVALASIDEAEEAIFDAVEARMDADAVQ